MQTKTSSTSFFESTTLLAAPLVFAFSTFFWHNGEYDPRGATLLIIALLCWIPAFHFLFGLVKPSMPLYAQWGWLAALYGCISGVCFAFLGYIATTLNIQHDTYIKALEQYPISSGILLFWAGPLFPLSLIILSGVLYRVNAAPGWVCLVLAVGAILFPLSRIQRIEWLAHISDLLVLLALGYFAILKPAAQR
jgi:hypothetical protein